MDGLFGPSLPGEGMSAWLGLRWIDSLDRHFSRRKVGLSLTTPQIDLLFGPSVPGEGKAADLTWDGLPLWTSRPGPASDELIHLTVSSPWGMSARPSLRWMDSFFVQSLLCTVTSLERKVDLSSPEMDCLFGPSLRGKESRPVRTWHGLPLWISRGEMSAWLRLRWIVSFDCHFPVKESQPDSAWDGPIDPLDSHLAGKESQPDHASDETSHWTVSSQGRMSARPPQMNGLSLYACPTTALTVQKIVKLRHLDYLDYWLHYKRQFMHCYQPSFRSYNFIHLPIYLFKWGEETDSNLELPEEEPSSRSTFSSTRVISVIYTKGSLSTLHGLIYYSFIC